MPKHTDELLATALASGWSVEQAAERANLSRATAYRRLANPKFRERVAELRRQMTDRAIGQLADALAGAVAELRRLQREAVSESTRLRAAATVLEQGMKAVQLADLERRIAELERLAHERNNFHVH